MAMQASFMQWRNTVAGSYINKLENQLLADGLNNLFGYHLVSLGPVDCGEAMNVSPIGHKVTINRFAGEKSQPALLTSMEDLSLMNDSVDVLVLPHILEYSQNPHAILREAERVVLPNGHIVIMGFNPVSCFGLCRAVMSFTGKMPWQGHFYHLIRIRDWLNLLGFELIKTQYAVFAPPIQHEKTLCYLSFMESAQNNFLAPLGGVYMMVARNLAVTPNVVKPRWKSKATLIKNGAVEPSGRVVNNRKSANG